MLVARNRGSVRIMRLSTIALNNRQQHLQFRIRKLRQIDSGPRLHSGQTGMDIGSSGLRHFVATLNRGLFVAHDGMVAEMELGFIKERQRAGIEAAKARGVYKGRPVTLGPWSYRKTAGRRSGCN